MHESPRYGLGEGVLLACCYAAIHAGLAAVLFLRRRRARRAGSERKWRRFGPALLIYAGWVIALFVGYRGGAFTAESVGASTRVPALVAFATGFGEYFLFQYLWAAGLGVLGLSERVWVAVLRANAAAQPRHRLERIGVALLVMFVNPVTEELMTRGLLVHQLALSVPTGLAIALGAVVNAIHHAYQGWTLAPVHLLFYAATIALLYSPLGLFGAIGFHFAADAMSVVGQRKSLRAYRELRRQQRKAKTRGARS